MNILIAALRGGIRVYQYTLSPDHGVMRGFFPGGVCRYEPTCSEYALQALQKYGFLGVGMAVRRVGRCHPFAQGGHDPVK